MILLRRSMRSSSRASRSVADALQIVGDGLLEALFDEVGEFEILEKHVEELFLGQRELERVLARAVGAGLRPPTFAAAGRPRDLIAAHIFLVAGHDMLGAAGASAVVEHRLGNAAGRDGDLFAMLDVGNLALSECILHGRFDLGAGAREKALPVAETLALGIGAAVDDVHRLLPDRSGVR